VNRVFWGWMRRFGQGDGVRKGVRNILAYGEGSDWIWGWERPYLRGEGGVSCGRFNGDGFCGKLC
jgi:hypothetical protein